MRWAVAAAAALVVVPAAAAYKNPTPGRVLVLQIPGMHRAKVAHRPGLDVYRPRAAKGRLPAVLVAARKGSGQQIGWAQLIAASGMAAVAFGGDAGSAATYVRSHAAGLGVDPNRLCMLGFGSSVAVEDARQWLRCGVAYYGAPAGDPARMPPELVVKAGSDSAAVNESIDRFEAAARAVHADVRVVTNAGARAGFDIGARTSRSREVVRETLRYLHARLAKPLRVQDPCVSAAERASAPRFFASDDTPLVGVLLGNGPAGIALAHGSNGDLCQWLPYARRLAALGYRVLPYDSRPGVRVDLDMEAAVEALRRSGAKRVAAAGSSLGALAAIVGSARLWMPPDAVISLSSPDSYGPVSALAAVPKLRVPMLFAAAEDDAPFADDARALYAAAVGAPRQLTVVPGAAHGVDLLQDPMFWSLFTDYLSAHLLR